MKPNQAQFNSTSSIHEIHKLKSLIKPSLRETKRDETWLDHSNDGIKQMIGIKTGPTRSYQDLHNTRGQTKTNDADESFEIPSNQFKSHVKSQV